MNFENRRQEVERVDESEIAPNRHVPVSIVGQKIEEKAPFKLTATSNKLTCALQDAPHIACDNQLLEINALRQAIQCLKTSNIPPHAKPPRAKPLRTSSRVYSILRPLRRPQEDRPPTIV